MTKLYLEFITTNLLPKLQKKIAEYEEWWIFKPKRKNFRIFLIRPLSRFKKHDIWISS
jgi:hypothetical protein